MLPCLFGQKAHLISFLSFEHDLSCFFSILVHYLSMCAVARGQGDSSHLWNKMAYFFALSSPAAAAAAERWSSRRCSSICISHFMWGKEQMALCQSSTFSFVLPLIGTPNFFTWSSKISSHMVKWAVPNIAGEKTLFSLQGLHYDSRLIRLT